MGWLTRLLGWTSPRDRALADELEAHRAFVEDELKRSGLSAAEAAAESRRRLGNVTLAREDSRDVWTLRWLDQVRQHVRFGLRALRREPLFALTAILTLGLGVAATTTVFSVVNSELGMLPYPDASRLVAIYSQAADPHSQYDAVSVDQLAEWRRAPGLAAVAAEGGTETRTLQLAQARSVLVQTVTANFFTTLGRRPLQGRVFTDADARGAATVILSERGWTRVFDRQPDVVGRVVALDDQPVTIVGIVADDDALEPGPWMFRAADERVPSGNGSPVFWWAIGRLADGATAEMARGQVQPTVTRCAELDSKLRGHLARVDELSSWNTTSDRGKLYFFLGASLVVLLLTVANTAGLVLSRVLRRAPEFALRAALGGGTGALSLQLVVEAALVVIPGCVLGLWVASEALAVTGAVLPEDFLMRGTHVTLDLRVLAACVGVAMLTVTGLTLVPLGLARRAGASAIGGGARTSAAPSAGRTRGILLVSQLALTVILLAGAGIFLKSFVALLHVPLGFEPSGASSAYVELTGPRYADRDQQRRYAEGLIEQAAAIPGVRIAAVATSTPLGSGPEVTVSDPRRPGAGADTALQPIYRAVSGDYFRAVATPILRGRAILPTDTAGAPAVAVVNQQFVRRLFPDEDPIGRTIDVAPFHGARITRGLMTIVGVASDIKEVGLNEIAFEDIYVPFAQHPSTSVTLIVRGPAADASLTTALRTAAAAVDKTMPVTTTTSFTDLVSGSVRGARFNLIVVTGFAAAALLVAAIGLYGAMAYAATARWREYGVRLALGATPRRLVGRALWQAGRLGLVGGVIGVAGALLLAKWLGDSLYLVARVHSGLLYGVTTTDPTSLTMALVGVVALALLAGAVPARRVSRIDPVQALRAE